MTCPECGLAIPEGEPACPICGFAADPAAIEQADRRSRLPKPRVAVRPVRVAPVPAEPAPRPAPEPPRAKRRSRIGAFFRAIGRGIASAPGAFDRGLVWLLRYEWNVLPDSFERRDLRVRAFVADAGRAAGKFVALSVWLPVRLALLLAVLALKTAIVVVFLAVTIVCALIASA